ncbi:hypothetical protein W97_02018 [Coniosporium apollinis CBS 100218]|uniref:Uncharacterized protein n=1 Tax=Coniosporium apollinis (strain CBS 100218) TaxID=1168221 RepID=R7YLN9_CONA1|nr:uncharacterized protein W97_02018 [Coniosporium apollinis CBS 100218]EON62793.1 hypothetical protein W97_02018 [Coniosporium apollinis CBS 100218]
MTSKNSPSTDTSSPAKKNPQRLPVPALFVGPPSRNTSSTSLSLALAPSTSSRAPIPLARQRSLLSEHPRPAPHDAPPAPPSSTGLHPQSQQQRQQQQQREEVAQQEHRSNARTDAMWAELQSSLEDVELSASGGTGLFGPQHSRALEELREAQIQLARAWARREGEEGEEEGGGEAGTDDSGEGGGERDGERPLVAADMLAAERGTKVGSGAIGGGAVGATRPRSATVGSTRSNASERTQLEDETEKDILLARERREANDRYFRKVNAGVLDVVAKLEEVARVMKGVERESKEIWGDGDSFDTQRSDA